MYDARQDRTEVTFDLRYSFSKREDFVSSRRWTVSVSSSGEGFVSYFESFSMMLSSSFFDIGPDADL